MKIYSDTSLTRQEIQTMLESVAQQPNQPAVQVAKEIDAKQDARIRTLQVLLAVSTIANAALTLLLHFL